MYEETIEEESQMSETVRERKSASPEITCGVESYVTIGAGEYVAFIYVDQNGDLVLVPEVPTEGFKRTVVHNAGKLYKQFFEIEKVKQLNIAENLKNTN